MTAGFRIGAQGVTARVAATVQRMSQRAGVSPPRGGMKGFGLASVSLARPQSLFLFDELLRRDISQRYKGSLGGFAWALAQPLFMLAIYTVVFGLIFRPRWPGMQTGWDYVVVLFLGKIPYIFVQESIGRAPVLIVGHANYVKRLKFPLGILPLVTVASAFFYAMIAYLIWIGFYVAIRHELSPLVLVAPLVYLPIALFALGGSWFLASLGAYFRDTLQVVQPVVFALMFLSPIFYPMDAVPPLLAGFLKLNPLTYPIEEMRGLLLFDQPFHARAYALQLGAGLVCALLGHLWFQRTRSGFADVV